LVAAGAKLSAELPVACDLGTVEALFAQFLGSDAVRNARTADLAPDEATAAKAALRRALAPVYRNARTWSWSLEKPYGYPGDFRILEAVYDGSHGETHSDWGRLVDRFTLRMQLPRAVLARKNGLRVWLDSYLLASASVRNPRRILSVASGSAREMRELEDELLARSRFTLLDRDERALTFARGQVASRPIAPLVRAEVGNAIRPPRSLEGEGEAPYDVAYSFGLFDYLPDRMLRACLRRSVPLLGPDGTFLFCLKDSRHYDAWLYDWLFDWTFVPRTSEDGFRFATDAGLEVTEVMEVEGRAVSIFVCRRAQATGARQG
jgi:hypothetical protein